MGLLTFSYIFLGNSSPKQVYSLFGILDGLLVTGWLSKKLLSPRLRMAAAPPSTLRLGKLVL